MHDNDNNFFKRLQALFIPWSFIHSMELNTDIFLHCSLLYILGQ